MSLGPVQVLVIGFDEPVFEGKIRDELERLRDSDVVRVIDAIAVRKDAEGTVERLQISDLTTDEAMEVGAMAGALIGLGLSDDDDVVEAGATLGAIAGEDGHILDPETWCIEDAIPNGSAAAIALIE